MMYSIYGESAFSHIILLAIYASMQPCRYPINAVNTCSIYNEAKRGDSLDSHSIFFSSKPLKRKLFRLANIDIRCNTDIRNEVLNPNGQHSPLKKERFGK